MDKYKISNTDQIPLSIELHLLIFYAKSKMPNLNWTLPVARWSVLNADTAAPDVSFIEPMLRRRLSTLSKLALSVARDCVPIDQPARVVFASRHGEVHRTAELLKSLVQNPPQPLSPNTFSLSVLNAAPGIFSIVRGDHSNITALASGPETLGYALLEAFAQYTTEPQIPVLVIYADEAPDPILRSTDDGEAPSNALALWITDDASSTLECGVRNHDSTEIPAYTLYPRQFNAALHCLETHQPACWEGSGSTWSWHWRQ